MKYFNSVKINEVQIRTLKYHFLTLTLAKINAITFCSWRYAELDTGRNKNWSNSAGNKLCNAL